MSLLRNIQRVLFLLFWKRLIVPQARDLLGDFGAKLTLVWATLSRLVIGASVGGVSAVTAPEWRSPAGAH